MPASAARIAAFDILLAVEQRDAFASELLHSESYAKLSPADHRLATEIVMGVLRWQSFLDEEIATHISQPFAKLDIEVLTTLRIGIYQLQFLERVPARAAIYESVELIKRARKRSAVPFVNAVLRKIQKLVKTDPGAEAKSVSELSQTYAHPAWLAERWVERFGFEAAQAICKYDQRIPETAIRIAVGFSDQTLQEEGIKTVPGRLLASARRVKSGDVTKATSFINGDIAIQDEGSQLVALLAGRGKYILDCCAAPGGKTRVLAERNPESKILAVELHAHRAALLRKLVPHRNVAVITADAASFSLHRQFDRILVDVPCSGTGTLARNPEIKWRLMPADLQDLASRQSAILRSAVKHLASGGKLIYSTCSLEKDENPSVVEGVLSLEPGVRLVPCEEELEKLKQEGELIWPQISSLVQGPYLQTIPDVHPCDGFFAAILMRS
jgi:16S rRNA (cytosine967-C5)-methyltransferase